MKPYFFMMAMLFNVQLLNVQIASAETAAELLANQMQGIETITAKFNQKIFDINNQLLQDASGEMFIKRPKKLLWKTSEPYEHWVISNGSELWLYDLDLEQVSKERFNEELSQAPALLLSGDIDTLSQHYNIRQIDDEDNVVAFILKPIQEKNVFSALRISFFNNALLKMEMIDNFDQRTVIRFSNLKNNSELADKLFEFEVPEGVDLVVNEP